jgi:hypothetical protein
MTSLGPGQSTAKRPAASVETRAESRPASMETVALATGAPATSRTVPSRRKGAAAARAAAKRRMALIGYASPY